MRHILTGLLGRLAFFAPGGASLRPLLHRWRGVRLGRNVWIAQHVYLDELYPEAITIGHNCTIGLRSSVFSHFHWGPRRRHGGFKPVTLEDNVFVGAHSVVFPGVHIGEGAVIRAGSVVTHDVPPRVLWGSPQGEPLAAVSVPLTSEHSYEEFIRGLRPLDSHRKRRAERPK